jgi:hypothetical protein
MEKQRDLIDENSLVHSEKLQGEAYIRIFMEVWKGLIDNLGIANFGRISRCSTS